MPYESTIALTFEKFWQFAAGNSVFIKKVSYDVTANGRAMIHALGTLVLVVILGLF